MPSLAFVLFLGTAVAGHDADVMVACCQRPRKNASGSSQEIEEMTKLSSLSIATALMMSQATPAFAQGKVDFELTADFFGKYIWRGQNLDDDPVFQPALSASSHNLTASIWGNRELTNINGGSGNFSEVDYSLDYSSPVSGLEGIAYSVGVIHYDFPGTDVPNTTELYWGLNFDLPLSPYFTFHHDVDQADGTHLRVGIGHTVENFAELPIGVPVSIKLTARTGWASATYNKYYWGTDQSKLNDLALSVAFPFEIAGLSVAPNLNYSTLLSDDIRETDAYGTDSDFFVAGITLSKNF